MLIACDGGAFQAGMSEGIRGCSIAFLNAAVQIDPSLRIVLVADPRLGAIQSDAIGRLIASPEIVYAEIAPGFDPPPRGLLTDNPDIRFLVDDVSVTAQREGDWAWYDGPPPQRLFAIASRIARPCDVGDSSDPRPLGVAVARITIDDRENPPVTIEHGDPRLKEGFYNDEAGWRWTAGRGVVPLELFPEATTLRVGVKLGVDYRYRLGGSFDRAFNRIEAELRQRARRLAVSRLGSELAARGARIYLANYYLPIVVPGLKLAVWAYDSAPEATDADLYNADIYSQADCVFSVSERTSRQLTGELGLPTERVVTTGIDTTGGLATCAPAAIAEMRQRYAITDDYILCVGMLEPRQSHLRLVQGYHRLTEAEAGEPRAPAPGLVILGKSGSGFQSILREIDERGLQQRVKILTDLDPGALAALYSDALFVAYPSLYEGFRPPLLDAIAYRKPIVTSRNSIMSEIAGDTALTVDFDDPVSIAEGLSRLAHDAGLRAELVRRDDERRNAGHWPIIARTVLDRLGAVVGE